jgi:hypothetical protein
LGGVLGHVDAPQNVAPPQLRHPLPSGQGSAPVDEPLLWELLGFRLVVLLGEVEGHDGAPQKVAPPQFMHPVLLGHGFEPEDGTGILLAALLFPLIDG